MLEIDPEKVCYVIVKAREFDAKVEVVEPDPGSNPSDEGMREVLEDYPDDPVVEELTGFIDSLNEDERIDLVALTWLGRGTYDDFDSARQEARRHGARRTAAYLLGIPELGDFLEEGLSKLGLSCEGVEREHL
jgi:hypothetical protein